MPAPEKKPVLLYFNGPWGNTNEFLRETYIDPLKSLLEIDFEVVSTSLNKDFKSEVQRHNPDLVVFHGGCEGPKLPTYNLKNTDYRPDLLRIGYSIHDPHTPSRTQAFSMFEQWGVHYVVNIFSPWDTLANTPPNHFYLPHWIDEKIIRDWGEPKVIPLALTGSGWFSDTAYPWRFDVFKNTVFRIPFLHAPSTEMDDPSSGYIGEAYGRMLNRAYFSAGCGTINHYLTKKLLEIPGARCCLIAEESDILKHLGFANNVNCLFSDGSDLVPRMRALLRAPQELQNITNAGYELVQSSHTARNRPLFKQLFELHSRKAPGQSIVQGDPFKPLQFIEAGTPAPLWNVPKDNQLINHLRAGYDLLARRQYGEARKEFAWAVSKIERSAEGRLGLAICLSHLGQTKEAIDNLNVNISKLTEYYAIGRPDPIDLAYLVALHLQCKETARAVQLAASYPDLRHPALNAIRHLLSSANPSLKTKSPAFCIEKGDCSQNVVTVHAVPPKSFVEWQETFLEMLRAR
jgi:tetratricopeptide (TPR) repeat protein